MCVYTHVPIYCVPLYVMLIAYDGGNIVVFVIFCFEYAYYNNIIINYILTTVYSLLFKSNIFLFSKPNL